MSTLHKWSPWTWLSRLFHKLIYISHLFSYTLQFSEWPRPSRSETSHSNFSPCYVIIQQCPIRIASYTKCTTTHKTLHLLYVTRQTHPSHPPKLSPACSHATMSPYNARPHKQTYTYVRTAHLGHPTKDLPLLVPLQQCCFVHLRNNGDAAHNGGCLRLCPTHTTQTWTDKHLQQGKWVLHILHIQGTYYTCTKWHQAVCHIFSQLHIAHCNTSHDCSSVTVESHMCKQDREYVQVTWPVCTITWFLLLTAHCTLQYLTWLQ